ncbi:MAG: hypothetical protein IRZ24_14105 [Thermogemmatispora sp.]|nr:hypothetical protein [Thermogemmatispora sp.]MBX5451196.1 hypothetical protein [Thermogemmatispora sp.]
MQLLPDIEDEREKLNQERVELCTSVVVQFDQSLPGGAGSLIAASTRHNGESIANSDQAGSERNSLASQSSRVTVTIPAFMMVVDNAYQCLGCLQTTQKEGPFQTVSSDEGKLLSRQSSRFMQELGGQAKLADVVEESRQLDQDTFVGRQLKRLQEWRRQQIDAQRVMI